MQQGVNGTAITCGTESVREARTLEMVTGGRSISEAVTSVRSQQLPGGSHHHVARVPPGDVNIEPSTPSSPTPLSFAVLPAPPTPNECSAAMVQNALKTSCCPANSDDLDLLMTYMSRSAKKAP